MPDSDRIRQRIYHLIGQLYTRVPALARRWGRRFDALTFAEAPFTPLRKPLRALYTIEELGTILEPGWAWRRQTYVEPEDWSLP